MTTKLVLIMTGLPLNKNLIGNGIFFSDKVMLKHQVMQFSDGNTGISCYSEVLRD